MPQLTRRNLLLAGHFIWEHRFRAAMAPAPSPVEWHYILEQMRINNVNMICPRRVQLRSQIMADYESAANRREPGK